MTIFVNRMICENDIYHEVDQETVDKFHDLQVETTVQFLR